MSSPERAPPVLWPAPRSRRALQALLRVRRGDRRARYVAEYTSLYLGDRGTLRANQAASLASLLRSAYEDVPFHRARMEAAGVDPRAATADEGTVRDWLAALPTMGKEDLAEAGDALRSRKWPAEGLAGASTGGTTSDPTRFFQEPEAIWRKDALTIVFRRFLGWPDGVRTAWLWGARQDMVPEAKSRLGRAKQYVSERLIERDLALDAGQLSEALLAEYADRIHAFRPAVMQAYPSAADALARYVAATGHPARVPLVVLTAEQVFDDQRARIDAALSAWTLAFYGAREHGWIAAECPAEKRLHINTAGVVLETDEDGALLVTDLLNHAMPFIRYRIGDRGVLGDEICACGDARPLIARLDGRVGDLVELPSGRQVPAVSADLRGGWIAAYGIVDMQILRVAPDRVRVRYVPSGEPDPEALDSFRTRIARFFFDELEVDLQPVPRLVPGPNGKIRYYLRAEEEA